MTSFLTTHLLPRFLARLIWKARAPKAPKAPSLQPPEPTKAPASTASAAPTGDARSRSVRIPAPAGKIGRLPFLPKPAGGGVGAPLPNPGEPGKGGMGFGGQRGFAEGTIRERKEGNKRVGFRKVQGKWIRVVTSVRKMVDPEDPTNTEKHTLVGKPTEHGGAANIKHMIVGAEYALPVKDDDGNEVRAFARIVAADAQKLTLKFHDADGNPIPGLDQNMSRQDLAGKMLELHKEAIKKRAQNLKQDTADVKLTGTAQQKKRIKAEAEEAGFTVATGKAPFEYDQQKPPNFLGLDTAAMRIEIGRDPKDPDIKVSTMAPAIADLVVMGFYDALMGLHGETALLNHLANSQGKSEAEMEPSEYMLHSQVKERLKVWWDGLDEADRDLFASNYVDADAQSYGDESADTPSAKRRVSGLDSAIHNDADVGLPKGMEKAREAGFVPHVFQNKAVAFATRHATNYQAILAQEMGQGKGGVITGKLLTPTGWKTYGSIRVGDQVIGSQGVPVTVRGVYPRGVLPVYRVTMNDGTGVTVDGDHLWAVRSNNDQFRGRDFRVMETRQLAGDLAIANGNLKWRIPVVQPVQFDKGPALPLDPYLLGVLLGDGALSQGTGVTFCCGDEMTPREVGKVLPDGARLSRGDRGEEVPIWGIAGTEHHQNPVLNALRDLDLMGCYSWNKFIPDRYLFASVDDRLALLQGLLDTDGELRPDAVRYDTASPRLAEQVAFLVQSLGGVSRTNTVRPAPKYTHNGEVRTGRPNHRLTIALPDGMCGVRALADKWPTRQKYKPNRIIQDITPAGYEEVVCIAVDAPDRLYVTEHFIVTHNTTEAIMIFHEHKNAKRIDGALITCPLSAVESWRKDWDTLSNARVGFLSDHNRAGRKELFQQYMDGKLDVLVMTPETMVIHAKEIKRVMDKNAKRTLRIGDEIHLYKTPTARRSKVFKELLGGDHLGPVLGLTGTLKPNQARDIYHTLEAIAPRAVGGDEGYFHERYCHRVSDPLTGKSYIAFREGAMKRLQKDMGSHVFTRSNEDPDVKRSPTNPRGIELPKRHDMAPRIRADFHQDLTSRLLVHYHRLQSIAHGGNPQEKRTLIPLADRPFKRRLKLKKVRLDTTSQLGGSTEFAGSLQKIMEEYGGKSAKEQASSIDPERVKAAQEELGAAGRGERGGEKYAALHAAISKLAPRTPITLLQRLHMASVDPRLLGDEVTAALPKGYMSQKMHFIADVAVRHLSNNRDKGVVIFGNYTRSLTHMKEALISKGVHGKEIAIIDGSTPPHDRRLIQLMVNQDAKEKRRDPALYQEAKDKFGPIKYLIAQTKSMMTGANLQHRANMVIHLDTPHEPDALTQSTARVYRQGQQSETYVVRPTSSDVEHMIATNVHRKILESNKALGREMQGDFHIRDSIERAMRGEYTGAAMAKTLGLPEHAFDSYMGEDDPGAKNEMDRYVAELSKREGRLAPRANEDPLAGLKRQVGETPARPDKATELAALRKRLAELEGAEA